MGRGGGATVSHVHTHTVVYHGGGRPSPYGGPIFLFLVGILFLILAIVVPIVIMKDSHVLCPPATSINRGEQLVCKRFNHGESYYAEVSSNGSSYVKVYKTSTSPKTVYRTIAYKNTYTSTLSEAYEDFSISSPFYVSVNAKVWCSGRKCDKVKFFWLTDEKFQDATRYGGFDDSRVSYYKKDFSDSPVNVTPSYTGNNYMHFLFSNNREKDVVLSYQITVTLQVYDVNNLNPENCKGDDCKFKDLDSNDILIIDYPLVSGLREDAFFAASIYYKDVNWSSVILSAIFLGLTAIACLLISGLFFYKILKKLGKIGKKVVKAVEKHEERKMEAAVAASSQPTVVAEPPPPVEPPKKKTSGNSDIDDLDDLLHRNFDGRTTNLTSDDKRFLEGDLDDYDSLLDGF